MFNLLRYLSPPQMQSELLMYFSIVPILFCNVPKPDEHLKKLLMKYS